MLKSRLFIGKHHLLAKKIYHKLEKPHRGRRAAEHSARGKRIEVFAFDKMMTSDPARDGRAI